VSSFGAPILSVKSGFAACSTVRKRIAGCRAEKFGKEESELHCRSRTRPVFLFPAQPARAARGSCERSELVQLGVQPAARPCRTRQWRRGRLRIERAHLKVHLDLADQMRRSNGSYLCVDRPVTKISCAGIVSSPKSSKELIKKEKRVLHPTYVYTTHPRFTHTVLFYFKPLRKRGCG
jgi:hypothetical protein